MELQAYLHVGGRGPRGEDPAAKPLGAPARLSSGSLDVSWSGQGGDVASDERGTTALIGFWALGRGHHSASAAALHAEIGRRGVRDLVDSGLTGQFAFVHHDPGADRLQVVTDRFGTRSMYVRRDRLGVRVANHQAALHPDGEPRCLDEDALPVVASHRRLLGRRTMIRGVERVLPGTCLELSASGSHVEHPYWTLRFDPRPSDRSFEEEVDELDRRLMKEMERAGPLVGESTVGVLLSGGVDSSLLAAVCARSFPRVVAYTATIEGFDDPELGRAHTVASALGLEHRVVAVSDRDVAESLPGIVARIGEPPHHPNNAVLDRLLTAMGADCRFGVFGWAADTFFGSGQIAQIRNYLAKRRVLERFPGPVVRAVGRALRATGIERLYGLGDLLASNERRFLARLGRIYYPPDVDRALGRRLDPEDWMPGGSVHWDPDLDLETRGQRLDIYATTGSALLRGERLARAAGVTPWAPFLTEPVVEYATSLDGSLKVRDGVTKPLLRALCDRYLPPEVSSWPKVGFETPWERWLHGPLADAVADARRDPFVPWALGRLGLTLEQTHRTRELAWMALTLSLCRAALDLRWEETV